MGKNKNEIIFPEELKELKDYAFDSCKKLRTISIPGFLKRIGKGAFQECKNLKEVTIANGVEIIGEDAFYDCRKLKKINLPNSIKSIESNAFSGCTCLSEITIPASVTCLGNNVFKFCKKLKKFNIDENNPNYKFVDGVIYSKDGTKLISCVQNKEGRFEIPNGVKTIGNAAFWGCRYITEIFIPESVEKIEDEGLFGCSKVTRYDVSSKNKFFCFENNALYNKDKTELIVGIRSFKGRFKVDGNTKIIKSLAFSGIFDLEEVVLPSGLEAIEYRAFNYCTNLKKINLPLGLKSINDLAFEYCKNLKEVEIPATVEHLEDGLFLHCKRLKKVIYKGSKSELDKISTSLTFLGFSKYGTCLYTDEGNMTEE